MFSYLRAVLIETYWNVKVDVWVFPPLPELRINRNILECKVCTPDVPTNAIAVLIETYWNVKRLGNFIFDQR